jgi:hypothetical protein
MAAASKPLLVARNVLRLGESGVETESMERPLERVWHAQMILECAHQDTPSPGGHDNVSPQNLRQHTT